MGLAGARFRKQDFIDADYIEDIKVYDEHELNRFNSMLASATRAFEDIMRISAGYVDVGGYRIFYESFAENLILVAIEHILSDEIKELIKRKKRGDFSINDVCLNVYIKECYVVVEGDTRGIKGIYIRSDLL